MTRNVRTLTILVSLAAALVLAGCSAAYYSAWEAVGREKRDLLRSNILKAQDEQEEAAEQFQDALTRLKELYGFEGGELEKVYNKLKDDYEESEERAEAVRDRIDKVENIAADLFREWEKELEEISSKSLREDSRRKLTATRARYARLHTAMERAEATMGPVLVKFRDQVLYLKHNLNAQAIGSLEGEVTRIEADVEQLVQEMQASIAEAEEFMKGLPR